MARGLENYTNIHAADADYPNGDIKDNTGANDGTPVNRAVYADMHQLLAKLLREAGITANGSPENVTNGYQYYSALLTLFNRYKCTSTSSVAIGTGLKTFTVPANMAYQTGVTVRATDQSSISNYMLGVVGSYSGTTLVINVQTTGGSGTIAAWNINLGSSLSASETERGIAELATQAEVNTGTDDARIVTPLKLKTTPEVMGVDGSTKLRTKIVNIGDWDMDTNSQVSVTHGVADFKKIRGVEVIIRDDSDAIYYKLETFAAGSVAGAVGSIETSVIVLNRTAGSVFDTATFNSTSYNRGFVTITYEA